MGLDLSSEDINMLVLVLDEGVEIKTDVVAQAVVVGIHSIECLVEPNQIGVEVVKHRGCELDFLHFWIFVCEVMDEGRLD